MKKRVVIITVIIVMACIIGYMVTNSQKKVELVQVPLSTMEPYEIYSEWKPELFEEYGFQNLALPADVYHSQIEKGETYLIGTFYTDNRARFDYFFMQIYRVLWGVLYDTTKVLEVKDNVYYFKDKCVIPKIDDGNNELKSSDDKEYMTVYVEFDQNESKVTFECRKVLDESKDTKKKDKGEKSKE